MFSSKGKLKRFKKPVNAGKPYNTSFDDYYFTKAKNVEQDFGFVVSNRPGGYALKSETCCDDIYRYQEFQPQDFDLEVLVLDDKTRLPITNSELYMISDYVWGEVEDKSRAMDFAKFKGSTDNNGKKSVSLYDHIAYRLYVSKEGYEVSSKIVNQEFDRVIFTLKKKGEVESLFINDSLMFTQKEVEYVDMPEKTLTSATKAKDVEKNDRLLLARLHFEYNEDKINKESEEALFTLQQFLENNPHIKVAIAGHTDDVGGEEYNQDLSNRRANAVVNFLLELGMKPKRMKAQGYGLSQPLAPNRLSDNVDNPEGRRLNRRTEIIILHK